MALDLVFRLIKGGNKLFYIPNYEVIYHIHECITIYMVCGISYWINYESMGHL